MGAPDRMRLEETRLPGGMFRLAPPGVENPRELTPPEKIALERKDAVLTAKAESRATECWSYGCARAPVAWVREVSYDFKGDKAAPVRHSAISSGDYPGPVPGFCHGHLGTGPAELARTVYFDRPEMQWGARPNRWFVSFTDGTKQGGSVMEIDPAEVTP